MELEVPETLKRGEKLEPAELIDKFLKAKTYEEEAKILEKLKLLTAEQLRILEQQLQSKKIKEKAKVRILQLKIDILQNEIFELLPEYPVKRKLAVIINGDPQEDRHINNVKRAIGSLSVIGFTDFLVMHDGNLNSPEGSKIYQYPSTKRGIDDLFSDLANVIEKDDMVFFYSTGHGALTEKAGVKNAALVVANGFIDSAYVVEKLKGVREKGARGVFTFDNCYTGAFPQAIIESGVEGLAFSSAIIGKESQCQFFAPPLFKLIEKGCDTNRDHLTTMQEIYKVAMSNYRLETMTHEYGEIARSMEELNESNYERIIDSGKPTVIVFRTTWCPACDVQEKELSKIWGIVGDQINIVKITTDKNKEAVKPLLKKMSIPDISAYPQMYYTKNNGVSFELLSIGVESKERLTKLMEAKLQITFDESEFINALAKRTDKPFEEVKRFVALGITDYNVIARINFLDDFLKIKDRYPENFSIQEKALLFAYGIQWKKDTFLPTDIPARDIVDLLENYDGHWYSAWKGPYRQRFTAKEWVEIIWKVVNSGRSIETFLEYRKEFSFVSKIALATQRLDHSIDPKEANKLFEQYPEKISEYYRAQFIIRDIAPEKVRAELNKQIKSTITISQKCKIILDNNEIPVEFDEIFSKYAAEFDTQEKVDLFCARVIPEAANRYRSVSFIPNIISLVTLNIPQERFLEDIKEYPMFSTNIIVYFYHQKVSLAEAKQFDLTRFRPHEI